MTIDQLRSLAQASFDEYNDDKLSKEELFSKLHYPMWLCAGGYVKTKNPAFIDLSGDILGLIQDVEHN